MSITPSLGTNGHGYRPQRGRRFDVGDGRQLTARQIAAETRCDISAVYARIAHGWRGRDLLRPRREKLFDCGGGEQLTIKQIMQRTGLGESAVRARIARGQTGRRLLQRDRKNLAAPRSGTMVLAFRLADAFPDRLPTTKEIRQLHPMCEQTAERWRTAMRAAREADDS